MLFRSGRREEVRQLYSYAPTYLHRTTELHILQIQRPHALSSAAGRKLAQTCWAEPVVGQREYDKQYVRTSRELTRSASETLFDVPGYFVQRMYEVVKARRALRPSWKALTGAAHTLTNSPHSPRHATPTPTRTRTTSQWQRRPRARPLSPQRPRPPVSYSPALAPRPPCSSTPAWLCSSSANR